MIRLFNRLFRSKKEKILIILRGLPGSGKSTFAELIQELTFGMSVVCTADDYFIKDGEYIFDKTKLPQAHQECRLKAKNAMRAGTSYVVIANTNTTEADIQPYIDMANIYGYKVFSLIVENRHGGQNIHNVPTHTIEAMKNRFQIKL